MIRDFNYFLKNKIRYEKSISKVRRLVTEENWLVTSVRGHDSRRLISLSIELGRLKGITTILNTYKKYVHSIIRFCLIIGFILGFSTGWLVK